MNRKNNNFPISIAGSGQAKLQIENRKLKIRNGFVLPIVIIVIVILSALATGLIMASYGARLQAVRTKNDTAAMLAAEAGYEKGIFWMSQQTDILGSLQNGSNSGSIDLPGGSCSYTVDFDDYIGAKPVFKIVSTGVSGSSTRVVDVAVIQEVTGWVMGKCRVPNGTTSTDAVNFADGEILDIPIHINNLKDNPDQRDIYIKGTPRFLQKVEMGESQKTSGGTDKYASVIELFEDGIYFDQPNVRISDVTAVESKVNRFRDSTNLLYVFTPVGTASAATPRCEAVQLEFFVDHNDHDYGKVRITNNCTVQCGNGGTLDYNIATFKPTMTYHKYPIYNYHFAPDFETSNIVKIEDTYVRQHFGSKESEPGGQIFVNGNVVIGGNRSAPDTNQVVKGKITVVATGNIWIADSIVVDGPHDVNGMPTRENPNVLGLIAQGVVKIIDPGLSAGCPNSVSDRIYPSNPAKKHSYRPVADTDSNAIGSRVLPHNMVVEAAVTVGGGGWGAENVGSRKEKGPGKQDYLVLRGTISESIRGVVGFVGTDGYIKQYYLDNRLLEGILPGDIWFGGKYVPAPAGWHDYRPTQ